MTEETKPPKKPQGFAAMTIEQRRAIASKGGKAVQGHKRGFARNPEFAAQCGRIGGVSVDPEKRYFNDRAKAAEAGAKGGRAKSAKWREKNG